MSSNFERLHETINEAHAWKFQLSISLGSKKSPSTIQRGYILNKPFWWLTCFQPKITHPKHFCPHCINTSYLTDSNIVFTRKLESRQNCFNRWIRSSTYGKKEIRFSSMREVGYFCYWICDFLQNYTANFYPCNYYGFPCNSYRIMQFFPPGIPQFPVPVVFMGQKFSVYIVSKIN